MPAHAHATGTISTQSALRRPQQTARNYRVSRRIDTCGDLPHFVLLVCVCVCVAVLCAVYSIAVWFVECARLPSLWVSADALECECVCVECMCMRKFRPSVCAVHVRTRCIRTPHPQTVRYSIDWTWLCVACGPRVVCSVCVLFRELAQQSENHIKCVPWLAHTVPCVCVCVYAPVCVLT